MEYPSCGQCNKGTSAADAAVAFFARIEKYGDNPTDWKVKETRKPLSSLGTLAPGFLDEFFCESAAKNSLIRTRGDILLPVVEVHVGPISQSLLTVFSAKLGMALFQEHIGEPLPLAGGVHTMWFLNGGLGEKVAHKMLSILPSSNTLQQGLRKSASGQFDYHYNSDEKSIVAALAHFHGNIHFFVIAMADPALYGFPHPLPYSALVKPGELLKLMPKPSAASCASSMT